MLNGSWSDDHLVHYCQGCCDSSMHSHLKVVDAVMRTILRERPVVPQLSRWSKPVSSLDFWLLGLSCHGILLHLFTGGLLKGRMPRDSSLDRLRELLSVVDPEALHDQSDGFNALAGARLSRTMSTLSDPMSMPLLFVLAVALGGLRYVSKFLQASVHSVRVKARHKGVPKAPPVFDLTSPEHSPVVLTMQFLSGALACGPGLPSLLYLTLTSMCEKNRLSDSRSQGWDGGLEIPLVRSTALQT